MMINLAQNNPNHNNHIIHCEKLLALIRRGIFDEIISFKAHSIHSLSCKNVI